MSVLRAAEFLSVKTSFFWILKLVSRRKHPLNIYICYCIIKLHLSSSDCSTSHCSSAESVTQCPVWQTPLSADNRQCPDTLGDTARLHSRRTPHPCRRKRKILYYFDIPAGTGFYSLQIPRLSVSPSPSGEDLLPESATGPWSMTAPCLQAAFGHSRRSLRPRALMNINESLPLPIGALVGGAFSVRLPRPHLESRTLRRLPFGKEMSTETCQGWVSSWMRESAFTTSFCGERRAI